MKNYFMLLVALVVLFSCKKRQAVLYEKATKVIVYKSTRKMQLLRNEKVLRVYTVALGNHPKGHKEREGDERTPEGMYILDWRNSKSSCYKSLHISYPNADDTRRAKDKGVSPGGMVMIHGLHPSIKWVGRLHTWYDWTDGCVGVSNTEMDEIWQAVPDGTPIEIKP